MDQRWKLGLVPADAATLVPSWPNLRRIRQSIPYDLRRRMRESLTVSLDQAVDDTMGLYKVKAPGRV